MGSFGPKLRNKKIIFYLQFLSIYSPDCGFISEIVNNSSTQEMFALTDILAHTLSSSVILDCEWSEGSDG